MARGRVNTGKGIQSGDPEFPGHYWAWDVASGFSDLAYWDGNYWSMPEGFPVDPVWGLQIENWMYQEDARS